jgi:hypothetical protein
MGHLEGVTRQSLSCAFSYAFFTLTPDHFSYSLPSLLYSRHYTLEEAQQKLAEVKPMIEEVVGIKKVLDEKGYNVFKHQYYGGSGPNGLKAFPLQLERLIAIVKELSDQQIEIKDLNKGLIDFPHVRQSGEEVYLCYLLGEPKIVSWHSIEGGFSGRRSLEEL